MIPRATLACAPDVDGVSALPVHVHIRRTVQTVRGRTACSKPPPTASMAAFSQSIEDGLIKKSSHSSLLITRASRSLPARSAASEVERLSAAHERGFRPACEIKTGTFDPQPIFCRLGISRSSLICQKNIFWYRKKQTKKCLSAFSF